MHILRPGTAPKVTEVGPASKGPTPPPRPAPTPTSRRAYHHGPLTPSRVLLSRPVIAHRTEGPKISARSTATRLPSDSGRFATRRRKPSRSVSGLGTRQLGHTPLRVSQTNCWKTPSPNQLASLSPKCERFVLRTKGRRVHYLFVFWV